ncbi:hypothetical protein EG329_008673 [Mollisiaceae sp. DMI_Dod_QoI]|nr:hypothetical protein EG329_008673 [Helotiales sp. DMI_Dod_QoI]
MESKKRARKWFHHKDGLTLEEALRLEDEAKAKQEEEDKNRQVRAIDKIWREGRDKAYRDGVDSRAKERERKREIKNRLSQGLEIQENDPLLIAIPDLEEIWWAEQPPERQAMRKVKRGARRPALPPLPPHQEEDVEIIIDTQGDSELQQDFLPFPGMPELESDGFNSDSSGDSDDSLARVGDRPDSDSDAGWSEISSDSEME